MFIKKKYTFSIGVFGLKFFYKMNAYHVAMLHLWYFSNFLKFQPRDTFVSMQHGKNRDILLCVISILLCVFLCDTVLR